MQPIPNDLTTLLKEIRSYLANAGDSWERRRELIVAINRYIEGGEVDLFVGTVREMSRVGTSYAGLMQTLAQMNNNTQAAANLSALMAQNMPTAAFLMPGLFPGMPGAAPQATAQVPPTLPGFDYFRMVSDFLNAQSTSAKAAAQRSQPGEPGAAETGGASGEAPPA